MASLHTLDALAENTQHFGTVDVVTHSNAQVAPYNPRPCAGDTASKPQPSKSWSLTDPESKRKLRVASYKVYTVEGRVKSSLKNGLRWLKTKFVGVRYG